MESTAPPNLKTARSLQEIHDYMSLKQATIKVLSGFIYQGKHVGVGEILTVAEHFAKEVIFSQKAERHTVAPTPVAAPATEQPVAPVEAKASRPTK